MTSEIQSLLMEKLQVIPYEREGVTTYRIVDELGHMVAKVNGKENIPICKEMVKAYIHNQRMKSLLVNRLKDILKQLSGDSLWAVAIRKAMGTNDEELLLKSLKSQMEDSPVVMTSIIGGEAVQILQVL